MIRHGAGRKVNRDGVPDGPWTPELLANAISEIDGNRAGLDLRTVQRWFQDNDQGIKSENIRWLAHVFGCGDPQAIISWQVALTAAQTRLTDKRRNARRTLTTIDKRSTELVITTQQRPALRFALATSVAKMFDGKNDLNLPISVWSFLCLLWLSSTAIGVSNITYSPVAGLNKQVGFIWSVSWNIGEMIFLPIFLILTTIVVKFWTTEGRYIVANSHTENQSAHDWHAKIQSYSSSFWAITFICFFGIFLVQWYGVYFIPLSNLTQKVAMVDWLLVALKRPDVVSSHDAQVLSFIAFLYSGLIYWFFFNGLLMLYAVVSDYRDLAQAHKQHMSQAQIIKVRQIGLTIMGGIFRASLIASLLAICIKLNAAYLITDTESFSGWLINDFLQTLGFRVHRWGWLYGMPSPFFTSFLLLFIITFVFSICLYKITQVIQSTRSSEHADDRYIRGRMIGVIVLIIMCFFTIGKAAGFSILLLLCICVVAGGFIWSNGLGQRGEQGE